MLNSFYRQNALCDPDNYSYTVYRFFSTKGSGSQIFLGKYNPTPQTTNNPTNQQFPYLAYLNVYHLGPSKIPQSFAHLKRGVSQYGPAPHKPVLLLSLIELIDKGLVNHNQFEVNADLVGTFK